MRKSVVLTASILLVVGAGSALLESGCSGNTPVVRLAQVELSSLHGSINTNGKVEAERVYEIRAPFAGSCRSVLAREGAQLKAGDAILSLENPSIQSELASARAELDAAQVDLRNILRGAAPEELNQAEAELTRLRLELDAVRKTHETNEWLLERQAISRYEVEQSLKELVRVEQAQKAAMSRRDDLKARYTEQDHKRAQSRVEAARSRIHYLEDQLARAVVRAPGNGTLYQFDVKEGAYANTGDLLGLLADLSRLRVRAFVDEPELGKVSTGCSVVIRWDALPDESWTGKVQHIPSQIVARGTRAVAEVLCSINPQETPLIPQVNVDLVIAATEGLRVPTLPRALVFPEGKAHFVWVIRDGRAAKRTVETGRSTATHVELTAGLSVGDRVIIPGEAPISEGIKVRVAGE